MFPLFNLQQSIALSHRITDETQILMIFVLYSMQRFGGYKAIFSQHSKQRGNYEHFSE